MAVILTTNMGKIKIELFPDHAPKTVDNFISYVNSGHYDGTIFHRVIDGFMIQGGGFEPGMKQKTGNPPIKNEANNGLKNSTYSLAMARTGDPHSASAQFFINTSNNDFLDYPGQDGWALEMNEGVIMDGDKAEHVKEASAVIGQYCDIIGVRSFPTLLNREADYSEQVINQFVKYSGRQIISLESATRHPLQSLTDLITIEELKTKPRPKVVKAMRDPSGEMRGESEMEPSLVI